MSKLYYVKSIATGKVYETKNPDAWGDGYEQLGQTEAKRILRQESIDLLNSELSSGRTWYVVIAKVSASGMQRQMRFYTIDGNGSTMMTSHISRALGWAMKGDNLVVNGCGMDMVFHTISCVVGACGRSESFLDGNAVRYQVL